MGFSVLEKYNLKSLIRSNDEIEILHEKEIQKDILDYLKSEDLVRQITDYGIFPVKENFQPNYAENIVISKYFDQDFNLSNFIKNICSKL